MHLPTLGLISLALTALPGSSVPSSRAPTPTPTITHASPDSPTQHTATATITTTTTTLPPQPHLDLREIVPNPGVPAAAPNPAGAANPAAPVVPLAAPPNPNTLQYPTVTTAWLETLLPNGVHTWLPVAYTQTFAAVPEQGAQPGVGSVGLGTIVGEVGAVRTAPPQWSGAGAGRARCSRSGSACGWAWMVLLGALLRVV